MPHTLLLVDDSVTIQRVIELTFTHEDVRVVAVGDGQQALEWLQSEWPDIVLADVGVPGIDGYALAAHIKGTPRLRDVPVLLLAGAFEPVDPARVERLGCDGVLVKPFEPQHMVSRVKELLERRPPSVPRLATAESADRSPGSRPVDEPAVVTPFPGAAPALRVVEASAVARGTHTGFDPTIERSPEPLEAPTGVWELGLPAPGLAAPTSPSAPPSVPSVPWAAPSAPASPAPAAQTVSLANAFTALLAAEQATSVPPSTPAPAPIAVSEASVEDAVRRVLVRMTDDIVRRIVVETAERLIREEIARITDLPD